MANFCTNCGSKLENNYNYCMNCGTKIDKSDIKQHNPSSNQYSDSIEKNKAKQKLNGIVGGVLSFDNAFKKTLKYYGLDYFKTRKAIKKQVEKEIDSGQIKSGGVEYRVNQLIVEYKTQMEIEREKLKIFDEIFESQEIQLKIRKYHNESQIRSIKVNLRKDIKDNISKMSEKEIRDFVNGELNKINREREKARIAEENARIARENARIEREKARIAREEEIRRKIEANEGGYCGLSCRHCYEEYFDSSGDIIGDFDAGGYFEYYCNLGHRASPGRFCEDYE